MLLQRQAISPRLRYQPALIACTVALTGVLALSPRLVRSFEDSRVELVHRQIAALDGELLHEWRHDHPRATCPITSAQLSPDLGFDPWGTRFRVTCLVHHHIAVTSAGPDRHFGTADDIR
jgi:hypothetical protein